MKLFAMKSLCLATAVAAGVSVNAGENLLTCETDFEATAHGWYAWAPETPLPNRVQDGGCGDWSLEVRGEKGVRTPFEWNALRPDTDYTVSFYSKGDCGKLTIALITPNWKWMGTRSVWLDPVWRKHSYTFRTGAKGAVGHAFCLRAVHEHSGEWFRIDGVKIEEGAKATPYVPKAVQLAAALEEPGEIHFAEDGAPVMKVRAAGSAVDGAGALTAEVVDALGRVRAARRLSSGAASLALVDDAGSGYYPYRTRLRAANGTVLASLDTPFVVTTKSRGNEFFGVQYSSGVPMDAVHRVGFRWTRTNTKFWIGDEKDGPRPFTGAEEVQQRQPGSLRLLGTAWGSHAPQWALGEGRTRWTDDVNKATNYLARLIHTTTNVVDHYEAINEPDLSLPNEKGVSLEECCDYLADVVKLTSKYVRGAGKPFALDVSGCRDGNMFADHVLRRTPESVDIVATHPYCWPRKLSEDGRAVSDPETGQFIEDLNAKTTLLRKYGKSRMVIGELGWSLDISSPYSSASATKFGWYLSRMFLLARTYPAVEYIIWYALANAPENDAFDYGLWRSVAAEGTRPLPAVAAACEAARRIPEPGRGDVRALEKDGLYLLAWKLTNAVHYAYWTDEQLDEPIGVLDVPPLAAFDYAGRRLDPSKLTLSGGPVYMEVAPERAARFEESFRPAVAAAYAKRQMPVREEVRVRRFSGDWKSVDFATDAACVRLGGSRDDVQPPDPGVQWDGPEDLSARVLLGWDDVCFYFFASVEDDVHCVPKEGRDIYMNDVVQIAFDPEDNARKNAGYLADDCEFGLCEGRPLFAWRRPGGLVAGYVPDADVLVSRKGGRTEYRAAIPWRIMGLGGVPNAMGCAFAIGDNDDNGRARYWLAFGNGVAGGKRPALFKRLVLVGGDEASK